MPRIAHAPIRIATGAALALLLAACGEKKSVDSEAVADSAKNATEAATATTPVSDDIDIEGLKLGRALGADSTIANGMDEFRRTDPIYAVMETDKNESGKKVTARWTRGDSDELVSEETRTVVTGESAHTVFRAKTGALTPGKYHLRIMYNGKESKSADFEVK